MTVQIFRFTLYAVIIYLAGFTLNSEIAGSTGNGTHFCGVIDGQPNAPRSHPYSNRRYARSFAANLNVGEPRTVRMIYFLPNDRPYQADVVQRMKDTILMVQTFFAEQMEAHGYGKITFRVETDPQGEPMVHRVDGQRPNSDYQDNNRHAGAYHKNEIEQAGFDVTANVYFVCMDLTNNEGGSGVRRMKYGGEATLVGNLDFYVAAHELGHAFGLWHDFRDNVYIMSYGGGGRQSLSACAAEFLSVHPYFNPNIPTETGEPPTVELISSPLYPAGSRSIPVRLKVNDSDGLHQLIFEVTTTAPHASAGRDELKACRGLAGDRDTVVEFDYDGVVPSAGWTSLSDPVAHEIFVTVVDKEGDSSYASFMLTEISPYHIATLGHNDSVSSVAFSPDGTTLASGSWEGVKLWDVTTRTNIATLGHNDSVSSVAFSPDGTTLASGSFNGAVKLWDVTTRTNIATLPQPGEVLSVAFSPDGTTLASGSFNGAVKLWDVTTRTNIATLPLPGGPASVAFSPDGSTLASGTSDGVKLWDVTTRTNIATLGHNDWVDSVAFSPDGTTLVSGLEEWNSGETVKLWDVTTRTNIATRRHGVVVDSVAFSPDGTTLASGSWEGTVKLWDVTTRTNIATLPQPGEVLSVAFSPDGTILASGAGTVELWDTTMLMAVRVELSAEIDIPDPNLRAAIEKALGKTAGAPIAKADMTLLLTLAAIGGNISNLTGLEHAVYLRDLSLVGHNISDISVLTRLTRINSLWLDGNPIVDFEPLASLTRLEQLGLGNVKLADLSPLTGLTRLSYARLDWNNISDLSPLVANTGLGEGDVVVLTENPLSYESIHTHIPALQNSGVTVEFDNRITKPLEIISGDNQQGLPETALEKPLVVEVRDQSGKPLSGVQVTFRVTAGGGALSVTHTATDENGKAESRFTLGTNLGTNTVSVSAAGIEGTVTFTAVAEGPIDIPDANLRAAVETALGKAEGDSITPSEMAALMRLESPEASIRNLTGLEHAANLTELHLWRNSVKDLSPVAGLTKLTGLYIGGSSASDLSPLAELINLESLFLDGNGISDLSALKELTNLTRLALNNNSVSDLLPLAGLTNLRWMRLVGNNISDLSPLVTNMGLGSGDEIDVRGNPLSYLSIHTHIPALRSRGVTVEFDNRTLTSPLKISGDDQQGTPGTALERPFVVEVRDGSGSAFEGVPVTFTVTAGGGTLSVASTTTDKNGRAESTLTVGLNPGTNTVTVSVTGIQGGQTFNAEGIGVPKTLEIVSGDDQEGLPGATFEKPFVVEVRDQSGKPLSGIEVIFSVTSGGGTLSATSVTTDSSGRAESRLTLGSNPGTNTVTVSVAGIQAQQTFNAEGIRTPLAFWIISGDKQQGQPGEALANPFIVEVRARSGDPFVEAQVMFSVASGGGMLSVITAATDSNGRAESTLTLGPEPGTTTVTVSVAGIEEAQSVTAVAELPKNPADINGDGIVNILDLTIVARAISTDSESGDVNGDGVVNVMDLVAVANQF